MKKFVRNLSLFLTILLLPVVLMTSLIYFSNRKLARSVTISDSVQVLVIGDSHTQKAFDPKYFPGMLNYSQSSECFNYSYYKLSQLLTSSPHLRAVVLGFGFHSLSDYLDEFITGQYAAEVSSRYFFLFPPEEQWNIIARNPDHANRYLIGVFSGGIRNLMVRDGHYSFLGDYETYETRIAINRKMVTDRARTHFFNGAAGRAFSRQNIIYLYRIVELCRQKNVRLYLINTPLHPYYQEMVPHKFTAQYNAMVKNNKLELIDLKDLPLNDSCYLPDGDHVNAAGARITTQWLAEYLQKHAE